MPVHSSTSSSNNKFKYILFLIFIITVSVSIYFIGKIYSNASKNNKVNTYNQKRFEDFYASGNIDLVFLGSSHSYCTFDPDIFDNILNLKSYQLGMPLQHPDGSYYTLLEVLKYKQPKAVVLEIYWDMLASDFDMKQADELFRYLDNPELKNDFINNVFPLNEKAKYFLNTARYQKDFFNFYNKIFQTELENKFGVSKKIGEANGEMYYRSKGYTYTDTIINKDEFDKTNQFKKTDGKKYNISTVQLDYIKKIVALCREKNIELFFVTAPVANVSMEKIKNYDIIYKKMKTLSDELGVKYLDYNIINEEKQLLKNENFMDDAHLNHSGVVIVSTDYANWLKENL